MSFLNYFRAKKTTSASIAKERLQIIVSHQRAERSEDKDYLPMLQQELLEVISKYVKIDLEKIKVEFAKHDDTSILELNIALPEGGVNKPEGTEQVKETAEQEV